MHLPDCSNMCHESSGSALNPTIGIGKGTVSLEDIHDAELIFVVGQNPGTNHPRMLSAEAAEQNPGTVVDHSFIEAQTDGFEAYREARRELDWEETEKATGLTSAQIEKVAGMLVASKASIF